MDLVKFKCYLVGLEQAWDSLYLQQLLILRLLLELQVRPKVLGVLALTVLINTSLPSRHVGWLPKTSASQEYV